MHSASSLVVSVLLYLSWTINLSRTVPSGVKCPSVQGASSCVCENDQGILDLTPLSSSSGPMYTGLTDPNGFTYSFDPCKTFTSEYECVSPVYVCQAAQDGSYKYAIADGEVEIYIDNDNTPYIYYTGPGLRETKVSLNCDPKLTDKAEVTTIGDSNEYLVYHFTVKSAHACYGGAGGGGGGNKAGVAGIVIILLLMVGVVTYFVVGAIIMKVQYQKTGSDLIINKIFWFALPGLIKEGFIFTFKPCFDLIKGKRQGYKEEL